MRWVKAFAGGREHLVQSRQCGERGERIPQCGGYEEEVIQLSLVRVDVGVDLPRLHEEEIPGDEHGYSAAGLVKCKAFGDVDYFVEAVGMKDAAPFMFRRSNDDIRTFADERVYLVILRRAGKILWHGKLSFKLSKFFLGQPHPCVRLKKERKQFSLP